LLALPAPAADRGRVALLVRRGDHGVRETPGGLHLTPDDGVPGDSWGRNSNRELNAQIAVMQFDVATLVANRQPLTLFGDSLFLDLDLSKTNLPPGSRVRVGQAMIEVTPEPHDGCRKFRGRFGDGALRFVSNPELRHRNLRGIYMRVVSAGEVAVGDDVEVVLRAPAEIAKRQLRFSDV
jgi:hypothetical protein